MSCERTSNQSSPPSLPAGTEKNSVILIFVDGVGLAPTAWAGNPLRSQAGWLRDQIGAPLVQESAPLDRGDLVLRALDANLDVDGLPQSATGQATLFSGRNAARHMQRHVTAFPGPRLRALLEEDNLLLAARRAGRRVEFANTFSPLYYQRLEQRRVRESVTVVCANAAGVRLRGLADLVAGRAATWDLERDLFLAGLEELARLPSSVDPAARQLLDRGPVCARQTGLDLAGLAQHCDLLVFETFLSDLVGHGRTEVSPSECVRRLDFLLSGLAQGLGAQSPVTVVVTSDHGNLEEPEHRRHTRHPVPLLAWGRGSAAFRECRSLVDVTPKILDVLGI